MSAAGAPPQVHFSADVRNLDDWARRTSLPLPTSAEGLGTAYARAHRYFLGLRDTLIRQHGWKVPATPKDSRLLFSIESDFPITTQSGVPRAPPMKLTLPFYPTSFFSPQRAIDWQTVFHNAGFATLRHTIKPLGDVLFLLQCLFPGLLTIVKIEEVPGEGVWTTTRALPPAEWVENNRAMLVDIFGEATWTKLRTGAADKKVAFKTRCDPLSAFER